MLLVMLKSLQILDELHGFFFFVFICIFFSFPIILYSSFYLLSVLITHAQVLCQRSIFTTTGCNNSAVFILAIS